jgi:hypothetical protein
VLRCLLVLQETLNDIDFVFACLLALLLGRFSFFFFHLRAGFGLKVGATIWAEEVEL